MVEKISGRKDSAAQGATRRSRRPRALTPRADLVPSCVLLRYTRHNLFDAAEITQEVFDDKWPAAGNEYATDALRLVVQLDGGSINTISTKVRTGNIRAD